MNAAEITDKLGLHSLRQRAWVRSPPVTSRYIWLIRLTVHSIDLCYLRRRSLRGLGMVEQLAQEGWTQLGGSILHNTEARTPTLSFPLVVSHRPRLSTTLIMSSEVLRSSCLASSGGACVPTRWCLVFAIGSLASTFIQIMQVLAVVFYKGYVERRGFDAMRDLREGPKCH